MNQRDQSTVVEVDGKSLRLTHLSKVMFPDDGFTKAELLLYYQTVAPLLLPHLRGRPLTLKAFPHGVKERPYYRRRLAATAPPWLSRVELEDGAAPVVEDAADLLWVVNQDSVELHPWLCEAATVVKEALDALGGVNSWVKTSGASGLHLLVGIEPEYEFEEVHTWAIAIDRVLVERRPDLFSMDYTKSRRTEKVLLDHNQVGYGRTTASIYSVRPLPGAPVSAPVTWEEVNSGNLSINQFTIQTMPERVGRMGDVAAELITQPQRLPHL